MTVTTYTTAPECYDGFGTRTVDPEAGHLRGGTVVRRVETPSRHVEWQRQRYLSGYTYLVADEAKWREQIEHGLATDLPAAKRYLVTTYTGLFREQRRSHRIFGLDADHARAEAERLYGETVVSVELDGGAA